MRRREIDAGRALVIYNNAEAAAGAPVTVKVGNETLTAGTPTFVKELNDAITKHGYPASVSVNQINYPMTVLLLFILVVYVTMVYGPIGRVAGRAVPTRIRYTGACRCPIGIGDAGWRLPARDRVRHRGGHRRRLRACGTRSSSPPRCCGGADLPARDEDRDINRI